MYTIYGIPNCDTVKKVMKWFQQHNIAYTFHDYKVSGITRKELEAWINQVGWEILFNKRSTSYRELPEKVQVGIKDAQTAIPIMMENHSIIKRPVIVKKGKVVAVGFDAQKYEAEIR